jgi:excisionase family DNA binding protein
MASGGFDMNALMDALAKRVADEVCARLSQGSTGAAVRPRLMTVEQSAAYLGRSKEAVEHMLAGGKLPTVRADRRVFLDVRDLDRWIEQNKTAVEMR